MKKLEDKLSGSYYTPHKTIRFMMDYLEREGKICDSVLEPSAGDGRFIDVIEGVEKVKKIVAVELIEKKVKELENKRYSEKIRLVSDDFLNYAEKTTEKYRLIIGNPPYINVKNMESGCIEKAKNLCEKYQLSGSLMKNIWVAFVLSAFSCMERNGIIFFVLPMEFLQVQYAEKIRVFWKSISIQYISYLLRKKCFLK